MGFETIDVTWGKAGLQGLHDESDLVVVVDVLSFSTAVDVAVSRGAAVFPFVYRDDRAAKFADAKNAILAGPRSREDGGPSLSPASLAGLKPGDRLVLPSPNGSTLSTLVGDKPVYAACLRNATAVAAALQTAAEDLDRAKVAIIAAGEHWADGSLRPALEDLFGAGAIAARLKGRRTADAEAAAAAYATLRPRLRASLADCPSGRELIAKGFPQDVDWASDQDCSAAVPALVEGCYRDVAADAAPTAHNIGVVKLRRGNAGDDAACGRLVGAAAATSAYAPRVPHAANLLGDRSPLAQEHRQRIVAEAAGKLLGFIEFKEHPAAPGEARTGGHVKYLFVDPAIQGSGIGSNLLAAAEQAIRGPTRLSVLSVNDRGLRWYMKRGYRVTDAQAEDDWEGGLAIWLTLEKAP